MIFKGMLRARGRLILMADADAATDIEDLAPLATKIEEVTSRDGYGIVVGSRAHLQEESMATRKWCADFFSLFFSQDYLFRSLLISSFPHSHSPPLLLLALLLRMPMQVPYAADACVPLRCVYALRAGGAGHAVRF